MKLLIHNFSTKQQKRKMSFRNDAENLINALKTFCESFCSKCQMCDHQCLITK